MLCRRAERIVCKNNYNITRIAYLARLFSDARFVLAVREPVDHVASRAVLHHDLDRTTTIIVPVQEDVLGEFPVDVQPLRT